MRHKYHTTALVLNRSPLGEANALLTLLTKDVGLVRARAQGVRKPGAKLAHALATFSESEVVLVRGAEGWRISGAVLSTSWITKLPRGARARAARLSGLLLRLVAGEAADPGLLEIVRGFFVALAESEEQVHDDAECRAALALLQTLGLDAGGIPEGRTELINRINRGIAASGL